MSRNPSAVITTPEMYETIIKTHSESLFPVPPKLEERVDFWIDVFTIYKSSKIILHDSENPERIYYIFDSPEPPENLFVPYTETESEQIDKNREIIQAILIAIGDAKFGTKTEIDDLSQEAKDAYAKVSELFFGMILRGKAPDNLNEFQENTLRIFETFKDAGSPDEISEAAYEKRIRAQRGASDNFKEALIYSGLYIKMVRDILQENGIPEELACLPFIESFYNPSAVSHKNAAGIWQFTRGTAKDERLKITTAVDERKDPYLSTLAAARKLKKENALFSKEAANQGIDLENRPIFDLGITAWNLGRYPIRNAIRKLETVDLEKILFDFRYSSKGFAVKNFYSEFVAALQVYLNMHKYFPDAAPYPPIDTLVEDYELPSPLKFSQLSEKLGLEKEQLHLFNPSLTNLARLDGIKIPQSTLIKVPKNIEASNRLAEIYAHEKYILAEDEIETQLSYMVRKGDTLSDIAYKFGIKVQALMSFNGLKNSRIYPSSVLMIPLK